MLWSLPAPVPHTASPKVERELVALHIHPQTTLRHRDHEPHRPFSVFPTTTLRVNKRMSMPTFMDICRSTGVWLHWLETMQLTRVLLRARV